MIWLKKDEKSIISETIVWLYVTEEGQYLESINNRNNCNLQHLNLKSLHTYRKFIYVFFNYLITLFLIRPGSLKYLEVKYLTKLNKIFTFF